jgi:branched-chain amino acid transport system substrate-binding protein
MGRRTVFVVALALAVTGLMGCGGTSDTATPEPSRVVTIGVIGPQEGGLTDFGLGILHSVELAVQQANASDAVPGWTIEVRALDDSSDPTKGVLAAQEMIDDSSVVAVVGPYNSGVALAMLPDLAAADLALISPSNTLTSLTVGDDPAAPTRVFANYFRMVGADDAQGRFLADRAAESGATRVAVVSETKAVSKGLADVFAASFEAAGGSVVVRAIVEDGASEFAEVIADIEAASPDLIFFGGEYPSAAALRQQASAAGLDVPLMGGDGIKDDAYLAAAGIAADGTLASSVGVPLDSLPSASSYLEAYEAAGFADPPSAYGPYAYDAATAIIRALPVVLSAVDTPAQAREGLVAALGASTLDGVSGSVGFDAFGDTRFPAFTLYRVEDGVWIAAP